MSNQAAVHKAFLLVLGEIKSRYGEDSGGLMAGFLSVIGNMGSSTPNLKDKDMNEDPAKHSFHRSGITEEKKVDFPSSREKKQVNTRESGLVSFEDMLKTGRQSPELVNNERPSTPSLMHQMPEPDPSKRLSSKAKAVPYANDFAPVPELSKGRHAQKNEPVLIEVKPLPKIRLSLMPSPREEDEDKESSSYTPVDRSKTKKKSSSSKRRPSLSWRKSGRQKHK